LVNLDEGRSLFKEGQVEETFRTRHLANVHAFRFDSRTNTDTADRSRFNTKLCADNKPAARNNDERKPTIRARANAAVTVGGR
jgi:hypothetical protein